MSYSFRKFLEQKHFSQKTHECFSFSPRARKYFQVNNPIKGYFKKDFEFLIFVLKKIKTSYQQLDQDYKATFEWLN